MDNPLMLGMFVLGITECFKKAGVPSAYLPFLAVLLGALYNIAQDFSIAGGIRGAIMGMIVTGTVSATDSRLTNIATPPSATPSH